MQTRLLPAVAVALLALSACNNKPTEVTNIAPDPNAAELKKRAPVVLPPSIREEATLRCADNSLVYISFFNGDKQVYVRTSPDGTPTTLLAEKAGDPFKGDGYELTGTAKSVKLTRPGKPSQVCDR